MPILLISKSILEIINMPEKPVKLPSQSEAFNMLLMYLKRQHNIFTNSMKENSTSFKEQLITIKEELVGRAETKLRSYQGDKNDVHLKEATALTRKAEIAKYIIKTLEKMEKTAAKDVIPMMNEMFAKSVKHDGINPAHIKKYRHEVQVEQVNRIHSANNVDNPLLERASNWLLVGKKIAFFSSSAFQDFLAAEDAPEAPTSPPTRARNK
jgi:hypothetical protein